MRDDGELRLGRLELRRAPRRARACEVCSAVGEMKFCAARPMLAVCWRSASIRLACADSTSAARSAARLCRSARSIAPITWPALTRLPSATLSDEQRAGRLGADDGRPRRDQRARELDRDRHARQHRPGDLGRRRTRAARPPCPCFLSPKPAFDTTTPARPATTSAASTPPTQIRRLALWAIGRTFGRIFHGRECRTAPVTRGAESATGCRFGGAERRGDRTDADARLGRSAQASRRPLEQQRAPAAQRRGQRGDARGPEHRREAERLAERAARDAADHARRAVAEDGVERLPRPRSRPGSGG